MARSAQSMIEAEIGRLFTRSAMLQEQVEKLAEENAILKAEAAKSKPAPKK